MRRCGALALALGVLLGRALAGAAAGPAPRRFDVRSYGARGDGVADDSRALQAALDAARLAGGGVVFLPAGTYLLSPPGASRAAGTLASLSVGSNTWIKGEGPATVLKVRDGVGSYRSLFSSHPGPTAWVENVVFSDLRFDQNCAASGGDVHTSRDGRNLFVFYLAWRGRNVTVERVRFDPVCGVNTVVLNASDASGLRVRDCYFRFAKGPTSERSGFYDNSAIYFHGRGATVSGNVFESTALDGARGAIELHGSGGRAEGNVTRWYHACVRLAGTSGPGEPTPAGGNGFVVVRNQCDHAKDAINVWSITGRHVRGVTIRENRITLAENEHLRATRHLGYFFGISFVWDAVSGGLDGDIDDVAIEDNSVTAEPAQGVWRSDAGTSGGISLRSAGNISNVRVLRNVLRDVPTKGIELQAMRRGKKASGVRIEENRLVNPGNDPAAGWERAAIALGGRLEDVVVAHNEITGTMVPFRGLYGIRLAGAPGGRVTIHDNVSSTADPTAAYR